MEPKKLPKFDWDSPQGTNSGHTRGEWGRERQKDSANIKIIPAYTIVWTKSDKK